MTNLFFFFFFGLVSADSSPGRLWMAPSPEEISVPAIHATPVLVRCNNQEKSYVKIDQASQTNARGLSKELTWLAARNCRHPNKPVAVHMALPVSSNPHENLVHMLGGLWEGMD